MADNPFPDGVTSKKISDVSLQDLIDGHTRAGELIDALRQKGIPDEADAVQTRLIGLSDMLAAAQAEIVEIEKLSMMPHIHNKLVSCKLVLACEINSLVGRQGDFPGDGLSGG